MEIKKNEVHEPWSQAPVFKFLDKTLGNSSQEEYLIESTRNGIEEKTLPVITTAWQPKS